MARVACLVLALVWVACVACFQPGQVLGFPGHRYPCGCPGSTTERAPVAVANSLSGRRPAKVHVLIDLERRELSLYFDYVPVRVYPVAVGKSSTPTPVGDWRIVEKAKWGEGFGSRWMRISVPWGTYGIHGTNRPWLIGDAVSGGCVRLFNEDADEVYEWVRVGTPVKVIGHPLAPLEERQTLEPGYTSSRVLLVQRALRKAGYYAGPLDGAWGTGSLAATRAFQRAKGFPATGSFDEACYEALGLVQFE